MINLFVHNTCLRHLAAVSYDSSLSVQIGHNGICELWWVRAGAVGPGPHSTSTPGCRQPAVRAHLPRPASPLLAPSGRPGHGTLAHDGTLMEGGRLMRDHAARTGPCSAPHCGLGCRASEVPPPPGVHARWGCAQGHTGFRVEVSSCRVQGLGVKV